MKCIFVLLGILISFNVAGTKTTVLDSTGHGMAFERGLSWTRILEKAKQENKYIFVDCYASWCGPCKKMDKEVYGLSEVGDTYNGKYVCVKMQMDRTSTDDEFVRASYSDSKWIMDKYHVNAYPTFLYFDSDGRIVKRTIGAMDADAFINLASDVLNPKRDYYVLLNRFQGGARDVADMEFLSNTAISLGDSIQAVKIASECIKWIERKSSLAKDDIRFIAQYTKSESDFGFSLFFKFSDSVNRIMDDDTYAQGMVAEIIMKAMVDPVLITDSQRKMTPDWPAIEKMVERKFSGYYGRRAVDAAKANWFLDRKDFKEWIPNFVHFEDEYGPKINSDMWTAYHLNKEAWAVFTYSSDSSALSHALNWSGRAILMFPDANFMDTYANLLYELGRKELALQWEFAAAKLSPEDKDIQARFQKMKAGQATWPDRN